jgi:hypothetical protein
MVYGLFGYPKNIRQVTDTKQVAVFSEDIRDQWLNVWICDEHKKRSTIYIYTNPRRETTPKHKNYGEIDYV